MHTDALSNSEARSKALCIVNNQQCSVLRSGAAARSRPWVVYPSMGSPRHVDSPPLRRTIDLRSASGSPAHPQWVSSQTHPSTTHRPASTLHHHDGLQTHLNLPLTQQHTWRVQTEWPGNPIEIPSEQPPPSQQGSPEAATPPDVTPIPTTLQSNGMRQVDRAVMMDSPPLLWQTTIYITLTTDQADQPQSCVRRPGSLTNEYEGAHSVTETTLPNSS